MILPSYLENEIKFEKLPASYREFFVRLFYYRNNIEEQIQFASCVFSQERIQKMEDYLAEHMTFHDLIAAKGFASCLNCRQGTNLKFENNAEYGFVEIYFHQIFYKFGIKNDWFSPNLSSVQFETMLKGSCKMES